LEPWEGDLPEAKYEKQRERVEKMKEE